MNTPFHSDKPFWTQYWRSIYGIPRAWALKGENLVHAFEAVAAASISESLLFDMQAQALMLAGMAIEVELKALLVNDSYVRELVSGLRKPSTAAEQKLQSVFYSHKLDKLAEAAKLNLSAEQITVAERLTSYIYWRGRYVIPTERGIDDIIPVEQEDGLVGPPDANVSFEEARNLIEIVIAEVKIRLYDRA